ncbi:hypothetical protein Poly30_54260 [Planctomycetes bacterium Poly30]|uniref:SGNH hydrolase-type esterase domain-containing protein n=1 Tax=Saltatorellus ferox TaxID=2528018 RepID=A0A518F0J9_9BACT|nr:hypothetical protein Poly30_54260 [Planctomycetes bacterium Poly30]
MSLAEGSLDGRRPRVIVLQIGVNNIHAASHTGNEPFQGIVAAWTALGDQVHYLDLSGVFVDEEGQPRPTLGRDSLHITEEGRHAWMAAMEPVLSDILR